MSDQVTVPRELLESAGYAMVPVEPTHEMLEALWGRSFDQFDEGGAKKIARIKYQGLLAAAPQPVSDDAMDALVEALEDILSGWIYIRQQHGDLYGVGWDRAQGKAEEALATYRAAQEKK